MLFLKTANTRSKAIWVWGPEFCFRCVDLWCLWGIQIEISSRQGSIYLYLELSGEIWAWYLFGSHRWWQKWNCLVKKNTGRREQCLGMSYEYPTTGGQIEENKYVKELEKAWPKRWNKNPEYHWRQRNKVLNKDKMNGV